MDAAPGSIINLYFGDFHHFAEIGYQIHKYSFAHRFCCLHVLFLYLFFSFWGNLDDISILEFTTTGDYLKVGENKSTCHSKLNKFHLKRQKITTPYPRINYLLLGTYFWFKDLNQVKWRIGFLRHN